MSSIPTGTSSSDPTAIPRRTIDVSHLPEEAFGERSPVWWGNTLMLLIESSTVAILLVTYFYLRMNFQQWPPPKIDAYPPIDHPVPDLGFSTLNVLLLLLSVPLMAWTHRAAFAPLFARSPARARASDTAVAAAAPGLPARQRAA